MPLQRVPELPARVASRTPVRHPRPDAVEPGLAAIGVEAVWPMGHRGSGAVVAITDSGVAGGHPALADRYRGAGGGGDADDYNWLDPIDASDSPIDADGHGTHAAGIAVGEDGREQIGAAPEARWIACRVGKADALHPSAVAACLQWVLAPTRRDGSGPRPGLAPDVVNASWSAGIDTSCVATWLHAPIRNIVDAGILVVASAGNRGSRCGTVCIPGAYPEVLAVANYDVRARGIHRTSSRGPVEWAGGEIVKPDVAAPGVQITSASRSGRYEPRTGTSMAAPHVAGAAALLLDARPDLRGRPDALRAYLTDTAEAEGPDACGPDRRDGGDRLNNSAGHGPLRIDRAVAAALADVPTQTPTASTTNTPTPTDVPTETATATVEPTSTATTPTATPPSPARPTAPPTAQPSGAIHLPVAGRA